MSNDLKIDVWLHENYRLINIHTVITTFILLNLLERIKFSSQSNISKIKKMGPATLIKSML